MRRSLQRSASGGWACNDVTCGGWPYWWAPGSGVHCSHVCACVSYLVQPLKCGWGDEVSVVWRSLQAQRYSQSIDGMGSIACIAGLLLAVLLPVCTSGALAAGASCCTRSSRLCDALAKPWPCLLIAAQVGVCVCGMGHMCYGGATA